MIIKKAMRRDWSAIKELIKLYPEKLIQTNLPKVEEFFVAVVDGRVVGCCALEVYSKRLAEIRSLAVAKDWQGRGLAAKLIEYCLKLARQKKIYEVLAITGATDLFDRFGFRTFNKEKLALFKIL